MHLFLCFSQFTINKYIHSKLESNSCVETELHYFNFCGKWKIHLYHDLLKYGFNYINSIFRIFCSSGSHVTFIYYKNAQNVTQCYSTDSKKVSNWAVFTLKPAYWKRSMLIYVYIPFEFVGYFVLCFKINIHANILCMLRQLKTIFKIVTKSRKYCYIYYANKRPPCFRTSTLKGLLCF